MKKKPLLFLGIGAAVSVISLIAALGFLQYKLGQRDAAAGLSRPAPEFSLPSLNGQMLSSEELRGKAVLLNFWATWCDPCIAELPLLEETAQRYADELVVIGINEGDSLAEVERLIAQEGLSYPILLDHDESIGALYKVGGYPTSVFIDADGIIRAIYLGEIPPEQLKKNLRLIGIK